MALAYCTRDQVLDVLTELRADNNVQFGGNPPIIPDAKITDAIDEASEYVRYVYRPRYLQSIIEAMSPLPAAIIALAKLEAARILVVRFDQLSNEHAGQLSDRLHQQMESWVNVITNGSLIGPTGASVPQVQFRPEAVLVQSNTAIEEMFSRARY